MTTHATIAVGHGRYADPWHPYPAVAERWAELLREDGWSVTVDPDVDGAMTRLDGQDLLVVVAGDPWSNSEPAFGAPAASVAGLAAALERGIGVVAMHSAVASLRDYPSWAATVGAIWVPGASMHPEFEDDAAIRALEHPLADGDLTVADERYSYLQPTASVDVVAVHEHDGIDHPVVWTAERGASRVAYDGLGHDTRSYDSPEHQALLLRLARWAARAD